MCRRPPPTAVNQMPTAPGTTNYTRELHRDLRSIYVTRLPFFFFSSRFLNPSTGNADVCQIRAAGRTRGIRNIYILGRFL